MDADFLTNKVILILTPQSWGNMLLAKHHYAIELAKRGNEVYFLNPPDNLHWNWRGASKRIKIERSAIHPSLFLVNQKLFFPYNLKFHSRKLFNVLIKKQIREILQILPGAVDVLWSFDLGNLFPMKFFPPDIYKVFHPVDEPGDRNAVLAGAGADILFSVTREIIEKYKGFNIPSYFINHGLADEFIHVKGNHESGSGPVKVGMSGNFLRPDIDRPVILRIIRENPEIQFHFYGAYRSADSNIGTGDDPLTGDFIRQLQALGNLFLHGVVNTENLAIGLNQMDALLICYDIGKDQSRGTNYHKVMEYLSSGKAVISNNITTYQGETDLIYMVEERDSNAKLPALFKKIISNLDYCNSPKLKDYRISYAHQNRYPGQLEKMNGLISAAGRKRDLHSNKFST
jgi:glycosyltransferase involved in cell wall biosynthesis